MIHESCLNTACLSARKAAGALASSCGVLTKGKPRETEKNFKYQGQSNGTKDLTKPWAPLLPPGL